MTEAQRLVTELTEEVRAGDTASASATLDAVGKEFSVAKSATSDPVWRMASAVPLIGSNLSALTEITVSGDDIIKHAASPMLELFDSFQWDNLLPKSGVIDTKELDAVSPSIAAAASTVHLSHERLANLDQDRLVPAIRDPLTEIIGQLSTLDVSLSNAATAGKLLPGMLGLHGNRNYLVLMQNNSEMRATGGIPGAVSVLSADDGALQMHSQRSAASLGSFTPPLNVDMEQESLFTKRIGTQLQNVNLTPHFPTAAATAKRMWESREDDTIDGVLALDPVALSYFLKATGPVTVDDPQLAEVISRTGLPEELTSENVVQTLLSDVYHTIEDPGLQDAYFASVSANVFSKFMSADMNGDELLESFRLASNEGRLLLWSSHVDEQEEILTTGLAGNAVGPGTGGAAFGIYFNDGTGAKMDFLAERTVQLVKGCSSDGYGQYEVRVSATNAAPVDAAISLPPYVTGGGAFGVAPGNIRTNYVSYGPAQSLLQSVKIDGVSVPFGSSYHGQRPVGTVTVELGPGERADLEFTFFRVVQDANPRLSVSPTSKSLADVLLPAVTGPDCP